MTPTCCFKKDEPIHMYDKYIIPKLVELGWLEKQHTYGQPYNYCSSCIFSHIQNQYSTSISLLANKYTQYVMFRDTNFMLKTYVYYASHYIAETTPTDEDKEETSIFFLKHPTLDSLRGIYICSSLEKCIQIIRKIDVRSPWIIQPSLKNCKLYDKKKFDITMWGSIICKDKDTCEIMLFKKGIVNIAINEFSEDNKSLTTHCTSPLLNSKMNKNYDPVYFDNKIEDYNLFYGKIKECISAILEILKEKFFKLPLPISSKTSIVINVSFDFIFDEDNNCYLLEINSDPLLKKSNYFVPDYLAINVYNKIVNSENIEYDDNIVEKL